MADERGRELERAFRENPSDEDVAQRLFYHRLRSVDALELIIRRLTRLERTRVISIEEYRGPVSYGELVEFMDSDLDELPRFEPPQEAPAPEATGPVILHSVNRARANVEEGQAYHGQQTGFCGNFGLPYGEDPIPTIEERWGGGLYVVMSYYPPYQNESGHPSARHEIEGPSRQIE